MRSIKLIVKTNTHNYPILIGSNLIKKINIITKKNAIKFDKCLLVVDKKVPKKFIDQIKKSLKSKEIYTYFIHNDLNCYKN